MTRKQTAWVALLLVLVIGATAWGWPTLLRRRHATYAMEVLGRIARGAHVYYVKPRQGDNGRMPCQFPRGEVVSTPAPSCCDARVQGDETGMCDPAKTDWNRLLWRALGVEVKESQGFVYRYQGSGTLGDARYTVTAVGDLDCDGVYATYVFEGQGDPDATVENCLLRTRPTFKAINPGE